MVDYSDPNWKAKRAANMTAKIKEARDASEKEMHEKNTAYEKVNPEYKATMDKVRAVMKEHQQPHWKQD